MAGVLTLVRLKLTLLRRSMTGSRGAWMVAGAVAGTGLAVSTIVLSALYRASPAILGDLPGVIYALWLAGWIVGPVWAGAPLVRAEHFALIPVPRRRLAAGLLGPAFAGITTAVTLLAFISLVIFGARLGVLPALVAVPAVVLQLVLVVLLSRLAVTGFGQVARSRIGSAVAGVLVAGLLIVSQSGWMLAVAVRTSGLLSTGVTPAFATLVRALPSGWGLYAVEAARRSDWLIAVGVLAGLAAAIALLLLAWSWKLGIPLGAILLFPQGIVAAVLKLAHARGRIWFLPLYLPKPLQWPACFVMIILGVAVYCYVLWTMRQLKKSSREPRAGKVAGTVTQVGADAGTVAGKT